MHELTLYGIDHNDIRITSENGTICISNNSKNHYTVNDIGKLKYISKSEDFVINSFISSRTARNFIYYIQSSNVKVYEGDSNNDIVLYSENKSFIISGLSDVFILQYDNKLEIFSASFFDLANEKIILLTKNKQIIYETPPHIIIRNKNLSNNYINIIWQKVETNYEIKLDKIERLKGGKTENVFLLYCNNCKYVFKPIGYNMELANIHFNIQNKLHWLFPKIIRVKNKYANHEYIVEIDGIFFVLEKYLNKEETCFADINYYRNLGFKLGAAHDRLQKEDSSLFSLINQKEFSIPLMEPFNLERDYLLSYNIVLSRENPSPTDILFKDNFQFLFNQIQNIKKEEYWILIKNLPKQVVHRDISNLHVFFSEFNGFRLIDIETISYSPRILDFPIALTGKGGNNPSEYIANSFGAFVCGYNKSNSKKLTHIEIYLTNLLIQIRFLRLIYTRLFRSKTMDISQLDTMVRAFTNFINENPILPVNKHFIIKKKDFNITYPRKILSHSTFIKPNNKIEFINFCKNRLIFNIYYSSAPSSRKKLYIDKLLSVYKIVPIVFAFILKRHPEIKILNISLFGSYLPVDNPEDIDLLVLVEGNCFLLEEFNISSIKELHALKHLTEKIGISYKGLENFENGTISVECPFSKLDQLVIIERTIVTLYFRHFPLYGHDFIRDIDLLAKNYMSQVADLLANSLKRFLFNNDIDSNYRESKVLSRLYEASIYIELFSEHSSLVSNDILSLKNKCSFKNQNYPIALKTWQHINSVYSKKANDNVESTASFKSEIYYSHFISLLIDTKNKIDNKELGEFLPVVAYIIDTNNNIVSKGFRKKLPLTPKYGTYAIHAEIDAIRNAENQGFEDWNNATLIVNLQPCYYCAKSITEFYGFRNVLFLTEDPLLIDFYRSNNTKFEENINKYFAPFLNRESDHLLKRLLDYSERIQNQELLKIKLWEEEINLVQKYQDFTLHKQHILLDKSLINTHSAELSTQLTINHCISLVQRSNPNKSIVIHIKEDKQLINMLEQIDLLKTKVIKLQ